ncbi:cytochrome P450 family protein [Ceratobasidium sp. AG-Ba]|nr:cytochrome P450 family protein [Ceratobasidium sp. AG-Ba]
MSFIAEHPLASLSSAVVLFFAIRKLSQSFAGPLRRLPGPSGGHWFWGHELIAFERPSGDAYTEWIDTCGQTYKIKGAMFHPDILVTVDPGALNHMLSKEAKKSDFIRTMTDRLVGKSLPYVSGDAHKRQRYQLSPFFTTQATRETFDMIKSCAQTVADRLRSEVTKSSDSMTINLPDWIGRATLDIIGRFAFDFDFKCGESNTAKTIQQAWNEQVKLAMQRAGFIGLVVLRAFPWIVDLPIPAIQQEGAVKRAVRDVARKVIERGPSETKRKNLLSTLVTLVSQGELDASSDELLDHISTLVLVGHETTAGSLTWALYELAKKPEYQTRLREEIKQLGREPTYEDLMGGMPFLDAVMKEIFRHRPGSSHTERVALKDDVIRLKNPVYNDRGHKITEIPIKAGQVRLITIHMLIWLAILEFKVILSTYLRYFEFHDTGATISHRFANTLQPYVVGEEAKGNQLPLRVSLVGGQK